MSGTLEVSVMHAPEGLWLHHTPGRNCCIALAEESVEQAIEISPPTALMELPFDDQLIARAATFAREQIARAGSLTLGELIDAATRSHPGDAAFLRCLFLILEQTIAHNGYHRWGLDSLDTL